MRYLKLKILSLTGLMVSLAMLAGGTFATAAQAAPEFKRATGSVVGLEVKGTSGVGKLTAAGIVVECKKDTNTGTVTGVSTVGKVVVTFTECEATNGTAKCAAHSTGKVNSIVTEALDGELGEVAEAEAASKRGLDLKPEKGTSFVTIEGECIPTSPVEGSVIGEIEKVKKLVLKNKLTYTVNAKAEQKIRKFVSQGEDILKAFGLVEATEQTNDAVEFLEKGTAVAIEVT